MSLLDDFRDALRTLRRTPALSALAVALLGLGVGANTATFTAARALLLRELPFPDPHRLVAVWTERVPAATRQGASWPDVADWRGLRAFEAVGAYQVAAADASAVNGGRSLGDVSVVHVTLDVLQILGAKAVHGRLFDARDMIWAAPTGRDVSSTPLIVSDRFARRHFGDPPEAMAQRIRIDGALCTIVGVLPRHFEVHRSGRQEVILPLRVWPGHQSDRSMSYLDVVARLRDGVGLDEARRELAEHSRRAAREHGDLETGATARLEPLRESWFGQSRPVLTLLLAAAALVLLTACANLAVLFLVRGVRRERDATIRRALGATRLRLVRVQLVETTVLALAGGLVGVLLAAWEVRLLGAFSDSTGLNLPPLGFDRPVLAFTLLASLATVTVVGLIPALATSRLDLGSQLRAGGPASSASRAGGRWASMLVVAEVAVSALLLAGAATLLGDLARLARTSPGFRLAGVLVVSIGRPPSGDSARRGSLFWSQLLERVRHLPGVTSAALSGSPPLAERRAPANMTAIIGFDRARSGDTSLAEFQDVTSDYFATLGIPFRAGRGFERSDEGAPLAIINESLAREGWGARDPVGQPVLVAGRAMTVIGVVADVRQHGLRPGLAQRQVYRLFDDAVFRKWPRQYLIVRTSGDQRPLTGQIEGIVHSLDPDRAVTSSQAMTDLAWRDTAWDRLALGIVGIFAVLSLLCTLLGAYAATSHALSQRRREMAIRLAVGATPRRLRAVVLGRAASLVLAGAALGIGAARLASTLSGTIPAALALPGALSYASALLVPLCVLALLVVPVWRATTGKDIVGQVRCD